MYVVHGYISNVHNHTLEYNYYFILLHGIDNNIKSVIHWT